ncbi:MULTISPECIES: transposase [unclassified Streptomyces]|uniref:transposase n=1 Tax=unclassified Streptomyces TaxID=2593676 RepID=UPI0014457F40|nr:transposase [Streptomyces sp. A1136]
MNESTAGSRNAPGAASEALAVKTLVDRATGVLMALVPCDARTAGRLLADTGRTTGSDPRQTAEAVVALISGRDLPAGLRQALRGAIRGARTTTVPPARGRPIAPRPDPRIVREHLARLRTVRRRTLEAPADPVLRGLLEETADALCLLMDHRTPHEALRAGEVLIAAGRMRTGGATVVDQRGRLTEEAWAAVEALLPPAVRFGHAPRRLVEAMLWKVATQASWTDLPAHYGPWHTVAERFRVWCADGTWERLTEAAGLTGARDDDGLDDWTTPWHPAAAEDR